MTEVENALNAETDQKTTNVHRAVELVLVAMLAFASLLTAWSGYEAARWGGVQSTKFSEASARRVDSSRAAAHADQLTAIDVNLFTNYLNAFATDQQDLADFYEARFRDEFKPAFDAWIATNPKTNPDAPSSPFDMPEYHLADRDRADQLEAEASALFDEGKDANQQSDDYVLTAVILASILFLAGISTRIDWYVARYAVIGTALIVFLYGAIRLATMPIE
jgi:hypothetical protein